MRILQVIDLYPPLLGGAQIQTRLLSRQLAARGHEVRVVTIWQEGLAEDWDDDGVRVHRIRGLVTRVGKLYAEPSRRDAPPFADPGLAWGIRRVVDEFKPDVVMVYGWIVYACALALTGTRVPMVVSSRDYSYACATRNLMRYGTELCDGPAPAKCVACAAHRFGPVKGPIVAAGVLAGRPLITGRAAAYQSVSNFVGRMVARDLTAGASAAPNVVVYDLAGDVEEGPPDPQLLDQLPREPFILFVGALAKYKGLHLLLEAYSRLRGAPPLVLMGIVLPETPASFPPGITVLRQVPHPTVMAAWERALFGVVPSTWPDPLPNVCLEAMSKGKAVVGSDTGGLADMIVHGETGLRFPMGDAAGLAAAMQTLIDSPELAAQYGRAGRRRVEALFAADVVTAQFEALFAGLLSSGKVVAV